MVYNSPMDIPLWVIVIKDRVTIHTLSWRRHVLKSSTLQRMLISQSFCGRQFADACLRIREGKLRFAYIFILSGLKINGMHEQYKDSCYKFNLVAWSKHLNTLLEAWNRENCMQIRRYQAMLRHIYSITHTTVTSLIVRPINLLHRSSPLPSIKFYFVFNEYVFESPITRMPVSYQ